MYLTRKKPRWWTFLCTSLPSFKRNYNRNSLEPSLINSRLNMGSDHIKKAEKSIYFHTKFIYFFSRLFNNISLNLLRLKHIYLLFMFYPYIQNKIIN